ncbi:preprotein translocase subunit YajC [Aurantivibrio plasticivorans]
MDFFIPAAMAQAEGAAGQQGSWSFLIMMGGLFVFMYLFMIRPQQKRQKEHRQLVESLKKGDEIVLNSGLVGKIEKVDDSYVTLDAGNNNQLKFQKIAVHAVLPKGTIKEI